MADSSLFLDPSPATQRAAEGGNGAEARNNLKSKSSEYGAAADKTDKALKNKNAAIKEANKPGGVNETHAEAVKTKSDADTKLKESQEKKAELDNTAKDKKAEAAAAREANEKTNDEIIDVDKEIATLEKKLNDPDEDVNAIVEELTTKQAEKEELKEKIIPEKDIEKIDAEAKKAEDDSAIQDDYILAYEMYDAIAEEKLEKAVDAKQKSDANIDKLDEAYGDALIEEDEVRKDVAEEYPSFKEESDKMDQAIANQNKRDAEQKATATLEDQKAKNDEAVKNGGLEPYYDEAAADKCDTTDGLKKELDKAKLKKLKQDLETTSTPEEAKKVAAKLKDAATTDMPPAESAIAQEIMGAILGSKPKLSGDGVIWDSVKAGVDMPGRLDDVIKDHMQPKLKHAYWGEFPEVLKDLNWMVKSMDRPKIDVEYVEQLRNNVKRYYPVKYSYGDISFTFWDNVEHKTINTLHKYFTGQVWQHSSVTGTGVMLLRDSTVIPKLQIWDLSVNGEDHLKYTFENASLASFDFDANEDETDEGVHTIQAVFKFERYDIVATKAAPRGIGLDTAFWI